MPKRTPAGDDAAQKLPNRTPIASRHQVKVVGPAVAPKKRHNRKRRDWNPLVRRVCAVVFVVELALIVFANPYLRVTRVRVEGTQTLSPAQVFAEARVPAHTNIFWMALRQPFARRLAQDPVVDHATRRIKLPGTLVLHVSERQPYATLALGDRLWLLDSHGVPFRELSDPYPGIPMVVPQVTADEAVVLGRPLHTEWMRQSYRLMALLGPTSNLAEAKIKVDQSGNLCLNRKDNLQILLGQPDALPQKVALAQAAVTADGGTIARRAAYIDVSCPQQPVWMPRSDAQDAGLARD